ncbi:hypothetical protein [Phaffia rhodozyma]|uniref:Uncharacterized protein n=1 Tax=Phaffia rhodozyma TaxID=264483 RepID=A0A0F7SNL7_PHARH|nr:hypothetical protein [Phaffia rhodozyma]
MSLFSRAVNTTTRSLSASRLCYSTDLGRPAADTVLQGKLLVDVEYKTSKYGDKRTYASINIKRLKQDKTEFDIFNIVAYGEEAVRYVREDLASAKSGSTVEVGVSLFSRREQLAAHIRNEKPFFIHVCKMQYGSV